MNNAIVQKFNDVDIIDTLRRIVDKKVAFYQTDLNYNIETIIKQATSQDCHKPLIWVARDSGTHCYQERDVFLQDTAAHAFFEYSADNDYLYYVIEITGASSDMEKITGNITELDPTGYICHVIEKALPVHAVTIVCEDGRENTVSILEYQNDWQRLGRESGHVLGLQMHSEDESALDSLLCTEHDMRELATNGDITEHIYSIPDKLVGLEADRIMADMSKKFIPNSPNETHYMAEISSSFRILAKNNELNKLFDLLSDKYKTLSLSCVKGRDGLYVFVKADDPAMFKPTPVKSKTDNRKKKTRGGDAR